MGREIRKVPANWEHPLDDTDDFLPLYDRPYSQAIKEWIDNHLKWEAGTHPDQVAGTSMTRYYAEWAGDPPQVAYYRPDWAESTATWFQVYETVSEGTPVSPPFATQEELIEYLATNGDFWDQQRGSPPWPRQRAEALVKAGWAPSLIATSQKGVQSGAAIYDS